MRKIFALGVLWIGTAYIHLMFFYEYQVKHAAVLMTPSHHPTAHHYHFWNLRSYISCNSGLMSRPAVRRHVLCSDPVPQAGAVQRCRKALYVFEAAELAVNQHAPEAREALEERWELEQLKADSWEEEKDKDEARRKLRFDKAVFEAVGTQTKTLHILKACRFEEEFQPLTPPPQARLEVAVRERDEELAGSRLEWEDLQALHQAHP
jgi:hypothetical protein